MASKIWERLTHQALPKIEHNTPAGLPKDLRFYKYDVGERFKMHKDGPWTEDGLSSRLSCLIYLNENFSGGATVFKDFVVRAKTGSALLFIHNTWHEGELVSAGTKYVLRTDVLYAAESNSPTYAI